MKNLVTKTELSKFDKLLAKRGFTKTENKYYNSGTKVTVTVTNGIAVFSRPQEISEVKTVREYVQENAKKRKVK